jgi:MATE family multidrug resistance protein
MGMFDISSGIVRGCGFQKIGAYVNLSAYYLVGIPAALCFAFVYHLGGVVFILIPLSY